MTTQAAAAHYLAEHLRTCQGRPIALFNPHDKPLGELPVIYGFNNGGSPQSWSAVLIAEDGTVLGDHLCSDEAYMPHDLGILEGSAPDRHEGFREHYPGGYRMEFVPTEAMDTHAGLRAAFENNVARIVAESAP